MQLSKIWWITYSDVSLHKRLLDLKSKNESKKRFWWCSVIEKGNVPISTYWTNNITHLILWLSWVALSMMWGWSLRWHENKSLGFVYLDCPRRKSVWDGSKKKKKKKKIWTSDAFFMLIVTLNSGWRLRCNQKICVMNLWACYLGSGWFEAQDQVWATC